jgi:hypothetical protein
MKTILRELDAAPTLSTGVSKAPKASAVRLRVGFPQRDSGFANTAPDSQVRRLKAAARRANLSKRRCHFRDGMH